MRAVEEYLEIDIAVVLQRINETHLESIDSYKNAILSVYFYKKKNRIEKPLCFYLINIFIGKYFELSGTDSPSILL
ncbi:hypothetical protein BK772_06740 [Bacillus thuringiensis serovar finitimus]|uniref:Uncharacterized protein n=1 Tax=Bacillus thuringiensis subsp. finitimus TaxID=29337 RepID=A0A243GRN3_BACTF|nr:hypothetical protein BK772_06740 [Bacillus thuringiensis serovar finitimus]